eukprot:363384-Chlamydomonas_euryale.AAC.17
MLISRWGSPLPSWVGVQATPHVRQQVTLHDMLSRYGPLYIFACDALRMPTTDGAREKGKGACKAGGRSPWCPCAAVPRSEGQTTVAQPPRRCATRRPSSAAASRCPPRRAAAPLLATVPKLRTG